MAATEVKKAKGIGGDDILRAGHPLRAIGQLIANDNADDRSAQREASRVVEDARVVIRVSPEEHEVNAHATEALRHEERAFQRGGRLVRVIREPRDVVDADGNVARRAGTPSINQVSKAILRDWLTRNAVFEKAKATRDGGEELVAAHPPAWCVDAVHDHGEWPSVRCLDGIVEIPVLRPDGTVLSTPGYDERTRLVYEPFDGEPIHVPDRPTRSDAERALEELREVYCDFPFTSDADLSACIAATLTPAVRHAGVDTAPLIAIDANTRGSGKSKIADVIGLIHTGREAPRTPHTTDDEEVRKQITAHAIAGDALVLIDNVVRPLGCASLDAALTCSTWKGRILGKSENTAELPMRTTWLATGNNLIFAADTSRRTLRIRLESPLENPEDRTQFRHPDLLGWVRAERPRLVRAVLTILRAYVVAERPAMRLLQWGSFERWSAYVRGALVWLGMPDPKETQVAIRDQGDEEGQALRALIGGLRGLTLYRKSGMRARDILDAVREDQSGEHEALRDAIETLAHVRPGSDLPTAKSLGKALKRYVRRFVGGYCIDARPESDGTIRWVVVRGEAEP
jgi:putative DNA primase/helicase